MLEQRGLLTPGELRGGRPRRPVVDLRLCLCRGRMAPHLLTAFKPAHQGAKWLILWVSGSFPSAPPKLPYEGRLLGQAPMSLCGRPFGCKRVSEGRARRFRCFRVSGLLSAAFITAAGLYGVRGPGPSRNCALEARQTFLVFRAPSRGPLRHTSLLTFLPPLTPQTIAAIKLLRPELCRIRRAPSAPRRSVQSCWRARP